VKKWLKGWGKKKVKLVHEKQDCVVNEAGFKEFFP